jgi:maltose alpha-D-glucosyltransferase/alpha-amylase
MTRQPFAILARVRGGAEGVLYDAMYDANMTASLLKLLAAGRRLPAPRGAICTTLMPEATAAVAEPGPPQPRFADQNRAETGFDGKLVLTLYRHLEFGPHADWEIGRHLAAVKFPHFRPVVGLIEYRAAANGDVLTLGTLHEQVAAQSDAWQYTLHALSQFFERALAAGVGPATRSNMAAAFDAADAAPDPRAAELVGSYLESARLLGRRLAELHAALATPDGDPAFSPEPIGPLYLRSVYQSLRTRAGHVWRRLNRRLRLFSPEVQADARELLVRTDDLNARYRTIMTRRWSGQRIRVHGDVHLGQVLITGSDVAFIHFGGDLAASPSERRQKRSALRDVAGLLRSWQRAVDTALFGTEVGTNIVRTEDRACLEPWGRFWWQSVGGAFLRSYFDIADGHAFIPTGRDERQALCEVFVLAQRVNELAAALSLRPEVVQAHVRGLLAALSAAESSV